MASEYLSYYPHMRILVMWGPSKETPSLATVDQLAKQARTRGRSPTCSLRFFRMVLKNTQLQTWRTQVDTAEQIYRPGRLSAPVPKPMRKAPHWLAWPQQLQGRISQLYTGRAHLHSFLAKLDVLEYSHMCPLGDGPGTLEHYIHSCDASLPWREEVTKLFDGAHIPDWTIILQHQPFFF